MEKYTEIEISEINKKFNNVLEYCQDIKKDGNLKLIQTAFDIAYKAHNGIRFRTKEPSLYHPINVALICVKELNLGTKSVICSLLHNIFEVSDITLERIEKTFGQNIAQNISDLYKMSKMSEFYNEDSPMQTEYFINDF